MISKSNKSEYSDSMAKKYTYKEIIRSNPNIKTGLNDEQVKLRIETGNTNVNDNPTNKTYLQIIFGNIFTFFNILMFVIAAVLLLVIGPKVATNLMFLAIIFVNLAIGIFQEIKSKRKVEKLKLLNDSKVVVKRNGKEIEIHPSEIVLDDIVILKSGDQIPADCIVLNDEPIEVNESLLTGESLPVKKHKGDTILAGSFVVSGYIVALADKIGNNTYLYSIESKAKKVKQPKSQLMVSINKIIRLLALIAIPLAITVFLYEFIKSAANNTTLPLFPVSWGEDSLLTNAAFYGGTTIAYMIPCGMALLASVAMATGVIKLADNNTLASNLYSVELLSRVDTLCLDKTGTLTDGTMTVENTIVLSNEFKLEEVQDIMSSYLAAFKANNQTSKALLSVFGDKKVYKASKKIEFSSSRKYSSVTFDNGIFVLGAPDFLTKDKKLLKQIEEYASHGLRCVLLVKVNEDFVDENVLPNDKENVALFILRDNIRPEVKDTMIWFKENDVDIKVISGDNIATVSYIAKCSGIDNYDKVVDMSKITIDDDFEELVMHNTIFGRVSPEQKAEIIKILKQNGRVTGVTGDGLNDLLAFKQADCSIALANGAAATKNVANLILLDSNFANMKEAVFQGRRVVNNIQRSASLFVMKDFLWMFITLLPFVIGTEHIIQPTVMTIVNVFITGIASTFIALEPDKTRFKGNFYANVIDRALSSAMFMFLPVVIVVLYVIMSRILVNSSFDIHELETIFLPESGEVLAIGWLPLLAICITICGFIIFFDNCRPFTKFRTILYIAVTSVVVIILYLAPEFFIISGTSMLKNTGGITKMFPYIFSHIGKNATLGLFRTMTTEQIIFMVCYIIGVYPLFIFHKKVLKPLLHKLFFSRHEYLK